MIAENPSLVMPAIASPSSADMATGYLAGTPRAGTGGTSWGAILAGATAAASLSLILLVLGAGLGFSAVSPWADRGANASTVGMAAILWLAFTQLAAAGVGGYIAGRLRTRWQGLHNDEVYFRDTAHGFLAWGVATLTVVVILSMTAGGIARGGAQAGASVIGGAAQAAATVGAGAAAGGMSGGNAGPIAYSTDAMFRGKPSADASVDAGVRQETTRILVSSLASGKLSDEDKSYLSQRVAAATGLSAEEAEKRVTDRYTQLAAGIEDAKAKAAEAADKARQSAAYTALWTFVSLLLGAFVASLMATRGGRRRDGFA